MGVILWKCFSDTVDRRPGRLDDISGLAQHLAKVEQVMEPAQEMHGAADLGLRVKV